MMTTRNADTGEIAPSTSMEMLIQLNIQQYRERGGPGVEDMQRVCGTAKDIATYSDGINGHKPDKDHPILAKIADAIAVLSYLPGGVTFAGRCYDSGSINEIARRE